MIYHRVENLSLSAKSQDSVAHCLPTIEDAFNTASFSGVPPNALVLVKFMDLGRIDKNSTVANLSNRVSKLFEHSGKTVVNIDYTGSPQAEAVFFSDYIVAYTRWIQLHIQHIPYSAWYWPVLARSLGLQTKRLNIKELLVEAWQQHGPAAHYRILMQLHKRGLLSDFLKQLSVCDVPIWSDARVAASASRPLRFSFPLSGELKYLIKTQLRRWGKDDARSYWLARSVCSSDLSLRHSEESLQRSIRALLDLVDRTKQLKNSSFKGSKLNDSRLSNRPFKEELSEQGLANNTVSTNNGRGAGLKKNSESSKTPLQQAVAESNGDHRRTTPGAQKTQYIGPDSTAPEGKVPPFENQRLNIQSIQFAGLFFLCRFLEALNSCKVRIAQEQAINLPWLVFCRLVKRLGSSEFEVLLNLMKMTEQHDSIESLFCTQIETLQLDDYWLQQLETEHSVRWVKNQDRMASGKLSVNQLCDLFICVISKQLWIQLKHGIKHFARIPGDIESTSTHLDVYFNSEHIDMKYRKLGLDVDPAWVACLKKVIHFHYRGDNVRVWEIQG